MNEHDAKVKSKRENIQVKRQLLKQKQEKEKKRLTELNAKRKKEKLQNVGSTTINNSMPPEYETFIDLDISTRCENKIQEGSSEVSVGLKTNYSLRKRNYGTLEANTSHLKNYSKDEKFQNPSKHNFQNREYSNFPANKKRKICQNLNSEYIMLCEVLESQLKNNINLLKNEKEKSVFAQCTSGKIIRKAKHVNKLSGIISKYYQKKFRNRTNLSFGRKQR